MIENLQRADLTRWEEAESHQQRLADAIEEGKPLTASELAQQMGKNAFPGEEIVATLSRQLSWSRTIILGERMKSELASIVIVLTEKELPIPYPGVSQRGTFGQLWTNLVESFQNTIR